MMVVLVEGPGDKRSVPILVQHERGSVPAHCVDMKGKSNIVRDQRGFEDTIRRQHALGERFFIVLMDGDVTSAPYRSLEEERQDMPRRADSIAQELQVRVQVCWAVLEIESWFIGGIERRATYCGLRGVGRVPANTETRPRDPKRWLKERLTTGEYNPRAQECLARKIDLERAKSRNRSMRTFF